MSSLFSFISHVSPTCKFLVTSPFARAKAMIYICILSIYNNKSMCQDIFIQSCNKVIASAEINSVSLFWRDVHI